MKPSECPLVSEFSRFTTLVDHTPQPGGIAQFIEFDPWSLYVPLSIEPRLDDMILKNLLSGGTTAKIPGVVAPHNIVKRSLHTGEPLPNLPLPEYNFEAPTLAWNAAINKLPSLQLANIVIKSPTIAHPPDDVPSNRPITVHLPSRSKRSVLIPPDTPLPQGGFVLQGQVDLFGTVVVGDLEKWMGPPPKDVVVGLDPPSIERVTVPGDFHMSMLIPLLQGTPFDDIIFRNVALYHQNYAFDRTKSVGWHFNADWVIDSSCGLLYEVLRQALQVDKPVLSIHASFGEQQGWNAPLSLHSFILDGVFADLTISPISGLTLTSIGVRLLGIRGLSFTPEPHSTLSFGFDVFGTMKLDVPGSVLPLDLDFEIGVMGSVVSLNAEISGGIWEDALGVKGLLVRRFVIAAGPIQSFKKKNKLEDVVFATTFSATSPWKTFEFDVSTTFSYMSSRAYLKGSYAAGGHFTLTAELDNFGVDEINDVFVEVFNDTLLLPDFDVHVGSAILSIVSGQGLSISLRNVDIAGYTALSVDVSLSSSGASLSGALSNSTITFGDVQLRDAAIQLAFWSNGKKKNAEVMLSGTLGVDFLDITVAAAVHIYTGQGRVEWTVVAELNAEGEPFSISDVVPEIKDSFLDFSLKNAVITAASKDDPLVSQSFPGYVVHKGEQPLCFNSMSGSRQCPVRCSSFRNN